jgi:hypothetical protein
VIFEDESAVPGALSTCYRASLPFLGCSGHTGHERLLKMVSGPCGAKI